MTELRFNGEYVFRTQRNFINPESKTKKEDKVNNAEKQVMNALAEGILNRMQDEKWQVAALQPAEPPPVLLAKTQSQKAVDEWYEKPGTIKTNVNGVRGLESFAPPPVLLADPKEEK